MNFRLHLKLRNEPDPGFSPVDTLVYHSPPVVMDDEGLKIGGQLLYPRYRIGRLEIEVL